VPLELNELGNLYRNGSANREKCQLAKFIAQFREENQCFTLFELLTYWRERCRVVNIPYAKADFYM